jgi:hypothetical protein
VLALRTAGVRVPDVAVLGEHHPVQPELGGPLGELGEGVLGVVAVHAVYVVVTDQVCELRVVVLAVARGGRPGGDPAAAGPAVINPAAPNMPAVPNAAPNRPPRFSSPRRDRPCGSSDASGTAGSAHSGRC